MGLDMHLEAEQYVSDYDEKDKPLLEAIKENAPLGLGEFRPKNVTFEIAYWRKANCIHGWFVRNVQDGKDECQSSYVSLEQLQELKDNCEKVLANLDLAPELLPAAKGFFFGSYEYDEWYTNDLKKTVKQLDKILSNPYAKKWWIQYRASW
jgi:hypothetical protein